MSDAKALVATTTPQAPEADRDGGRALDGGRAATTGLVVGGAVLLGLGVICALSGAVLVWVGSLSPGVVRVGPGMAGGLGFARVGMGVALLGLALGAGLLGVALLFWHAVTRLRQLRGDLAMAAPVLPVLPVLPVPPVPVLPESAASTLDEQKETAAALARVVTDLGGALTRAEDAAAQIERARAEAQQGASQAAQAFFEEWEEWEVEGQQRHAQRQEQIDGVLTHVGALAEQLGQLMQQTERLGAVLTGAAGAIAAAQEAAHESALATAHETALVAAREAAHEVGQELTRVLGQELTRVLGQELTRVLGQELTRELRHELERQRTLDEKTPDADRAEAVDTAGVALAVAGVAELRTALEAAARAEVQALNDASGQSVRLFTGVARHLDQTWNGVKDAAASVQATADEVRRSREAIDRLREGLDKAREAIDKALVRLIGQEGRGREVAQQIAELFKGVEALHDAAQAQAEAQTRQQSLNRAEQTTLATNLDRLRKSVERLGGGGGGPRR